MEPPGGRTFLRYGCSQISISQTIENDTDTQHDPLSKTCDESETLVCAALVSEAVYLSRKRRNEETQKRHAKSLSHAFAEQLLKCRAPRTNEQFVGSVHARNQLALLLGHSLVLFCSQCGAVNAGGSLRLLKSQRDGSRESRRKARRKLERGLLPNAQVPTNARRTF